jgi:hypothetical protein
LILFLQELREKHAHGDDRCATQCERVDCFLELLDTERTRQLQLCANVS